MTVDEPLKDQFDQFRTDFECLRAEIAKVVVGQDDVVENTLTALIGGGHVLLEGVPGLGKTLLVRTLADALQSKFSRIQFTPDLMPADVIGTNVMVETDTGQRQIQFQGGPIFTNILLADEINRATPKTQSALLEAMQEHSVTIGGVTHPLPGLFFVMATQNPLEMEGTYPLPEAQLDRFFFKLIVRFPRTDEIEMILDRTTESENPAAMSTLSGDRIVEMSALARQIPIANDVRRYGISLIMATHPEHDEATDMTRRYVRYGSSPRGAQALILAAKIRAALDQRYHVARDDLRAVAPHVLRHRLILSFEGQAENIQTDDVVAEITRTAPEHAAVASA